MTGDTIEGDLQAQLMTTLWRQGEGTVARVRSELPAQHRSAYTTVQTVLNRLAQRGLLDRRKVGAQISYTPKLSEGEYLARSIQRTLAASSPEARQLALATLIGSIDRREFARLQGRAADPASLRGVEGGP